MSAWLGEISFSSLPIEFCKYYFAKKRRDGVVVRTSVSQAVGLGLIILSSYTEELKKRYSCICLALETQGIVWKKAKFAWCLWVSLITGFFHLYMADSGGV